MKEETSAWPSSRSRSALAGWARTDAARWGRPTGLPAARRAAIGDGIDLEAELAQAFGHRLRATLAVAAGVEQALGEQRAAVVDPVAQHVQVLVDAVDGRDLCGGHDAHAAEGARRERLVDPVDGVVVGERQQLDARAGRVLDHLGRRQVAVRVQRMRLEIEGRGVHRAREYLPIRRECPGAWCSP